MRSALQAIVISVALVTGACSGSSYLRSFELRRSVCDLSYPGVICTQPGSGTVSASDEPKGLVFKQGRSHNFLFEKRADGTWGPLQESTK